MIRCCQENLIKIVVFDNSKSLGAELGTYRNIRTSREKLRPL